MNTNEEIGKIREIIDKHFTTGIDLKSDKELKEILLEFTNWKNEQFEQLVKDYIKIAYDNGQDASLLEDLLTDI